MLPPPVITAPGTVAFCVAAASAPGLNVNDTENLMGGFAGGSYCH